MTINKEVKTVEEQLELELTTPVDQAGTDYEMVHKMRDALSEMYVMFMMQEDYSETEKIDVLNLTRETLDEYTKTYG